MPIIETVAFPDVILTLLSLAFIVLCVGVSGSQSKSKQTSQSTSESGTKFPWEQMQYGGQYLGKMPTLEELAKMAPSTTGLFGGTTGIYSPTQGQPSAATPQVGISDAVNSATAPKSYSMSDFAATIEGDNHAKYRIPMVQQQLQNAGYDPNAYTLEQLQAATKGNTDMMITKGVTALADEQAQQQAVMQQQSTPFASQTVAPGVGAGLPGGVEGSIANLGFGQTPQTYQQREVEAAPAVTARGVSDMFSQGGREKLANEMYEAQYLPVERRLNLEQQQADRGLNAQLAQAGLASSGAGIGQRAQQGMEYTRERAAASKEAASQAAVQAQTMRLEAAGLDVQAQTTSAANVLQGNIANADNYLKAIGLTQDGAAEARSSFLNLLNLQEQDLARMDATSLASLSAMMEAYLAEWGVLNQAGQFQTTQETGKKTSSSGSGGISLSTGATAAT